MTGLQRDRLTWLVYLQLGTYGYILYGLGPAIGLLRDEQDISRTLSGLHGTALALGALMVGIVGPRVVHRLGRPFTLWAGLIAACLGAVIFCSATVLPVTLFGAFVATFGGSFVVTVSSSTMVDHHGVSAPGVLNELHATAAVVGLVAPLLIGGAVGLGLGWRVGLLVAVALTGVLAVTMGRVPIPDQRLTVTHPERGTGSLPRSYWWAWSVLAFCVAVEFSMTIWTSDILRDRVALSEGPAAAGVTALVAGMAVGRVAGGRLALRYRPDGLLLAAIALAATGFAVFWLSTVAVLSILGLVACGLGISVHFPVGLSRAMATAEGRLDLAATRTSLAVGIAIGVGPFLLGALADGVGTHRAFLIVPAFLAVAATGVILSPTPSRTPR